MVEAQIKFIGPITKCRNNTKLNLRRSSEKFEGMFQPIENQTSVREEKFHSETPAGRFSGEFYKGLWEKRCSLLDRRRESDFGSGSREFLRAS